MPVSQINVLSTDKDKQSQNFPGKISNFVGNVVVEWLERRARDQHGLSSKTHSRHSVVSLGKTLYGTFPCLVVLASSSKLQSYLY